MTTNTLLTTYLSNIRIVMVNTTLPANIGSAARAMHTMGLSELVVIEPKHPIDDDAFAHAAGARDILDNIIIVKSLEEALADCHWVFATSSRQRHIPKPVLTPRQSAQLFSQHLKDLNDLNSEQDSPANQDVSAVKIAIVFGREDRGLTNDELALADYHIQIPTNPNYGVLNVAAAVQVIASSFYEVLEECSHSLQNNKFDKNATHAENSIALNFRQTWDEPPITHAQAQQLEQQFLQMLQLLGIFHREQSKVMPQRVSRLLGRLQLDIKEYQLLQATIATIAKKLSQ